MLNKELFLKYIEELEDLKTVFINKNHDVDDSIHIHFIDYCIRIINSLNCLPGQSIDILTYLARCILEVNIIIKWLPSNIDNYKALSWSAEKTNLDITISMEKLRLSECSDIKEREKLASEFNKFKLKVINKLGDKNSVKYKDNNKIHKILRQPKQIAQNPDYFKAYYDLFSKICHPTPWIIIKSENEHEYDHINNEALFVINESMESIINSLKKLTDEKPL